jgi:hypothetical protein
MNPATDLSGLMKLKTISGHNLYSTGNHSNSTTIKHGLLVILVIHQTNYHDATRAGWRHLAEFPPPWPCLSARHRLPHAVLPPRAFKRLLETAPCWMVWPIFLLSLIRPLLIGVRPRPPLVLPTQSWSEGGPPADFRNNPQLEQTNWLHE